MAYANYLYTPEGFFNEIAQLDSQDDVLDACIELLQYLEDNYKVSTISKKLSGYKKLFYGYISDLPELNEIVTVRDYCEDGEYEYTFKNGNVRFYNLIQKEQHVAARLLSLSQEQLLELVDRQIDLLIALEEAAA